MKAYILIKDFERRGKVSKEGTKVYLSPEQAQKLIDGGFIAGGDDKPKKKAEKKKTTKKTEIKEVENVEEKEEKNEI